MTLSRGDKVIKLNIATGEPMTTDEEAYIEYEVHDIGATLNLLREGEHETPDVFVIALLRKTK